MADQHHAALQVFLEQDFGKARRILRHHIRMQRSNVSQLFERIAEETETISVVDGVEINLELYLFKRIGLQRRS